MVCRMLVAILLVAGCASIGQPPAKEEAPAAAGSGPAIAEFQGEYRFLSNFWPARVEFEGLTYPSAEHAYQAAKSLDPSERKRIAGLATPEEAKAAGRALPVRADWEQVKFEVMERVVRDKFTRNAELREKLLATGDAELVEGNSWGDRVWGVYQGQGENRLGKILMAVRGELRAAPPAPAIAITVDSTEAPELEEWGQKAKAVCETWYPRICEELASEGFTPRTQAKIVFKKEMRVPAATSGGTISVNATYVLKHEDDLGMMVHELVHVVQAYPRNKANMGWLVEGIADYIRFWLYEPRVRQRAINREKASYRDSYRTTAAFIGWLIAKKDPQIVRKLNAALRRGECDEETIRQLLGSSVDELWRAFLDDGAPASPAVPQP